MSRTKFIFAGLLLPLFCQAQVVIGPGTQMAAQENTIIIVAGAGNLISNGTWEEPAKSNLHVIGFSGTQISGDWAFRELTLNAPGIINVDGNIAVTRKMEFNSGILTPQQNSKIVYIGPVDFLQDEGDGDSYVDGMFYQLAKGSRQFPIGAGSTYAPLRFSDNLSMEGLIGVQVLNANSQLKPDGNVVVEVISNRYWQIDVADPTKIGSAVNVGLRGITITDGSPVVVQGDATNTTAINLGSSSLLDDNVTSKDPVSAKIIAIGKTTEVNVKIHDLITPFANDSINDGLYIENVNRFTFKKVTLLDRWGVVAQQWGSEFSNDPAENRFDYSTLSPGSYICILEYGNDGEKPRKISQMVTVLKAN